MNKICANKAAWAIIPEQVKIRNAKWLIGTHIYLCRLPKPIFLSAKNQTSFHNLLQSRLKTE